MAEFQTNLGDDREHTNSEDAPAWPTSPAEPILSGLGLPVEFAGQLGGVSEARLPLVPTGVLPQVFVTDHRQPERRSRTAKPKNPRRQAAGRRNRALRRGLSEAGRDRLRQAALIHRPWVFSTGPRTTAGKAIVAANGQRRQTDGCSVRNLRR